MANNGKGVCVCLHGGNIGLDTKDWDKINISNSKLFKKDDLQVNSIIYSLISSPQDDGFPLSLKIEGAVSLSSTLEGKVILKVIYRARILEDSSSIETINPCTPINLTLHWGFNVNSDGQSENILDHKLFLDVSTRV